MDEQPKSPSTKVAFLTIFFASVVLFGMYNASLTSFLAVTKLQIPFTDLYDLYKNTDYRVAIVDESALMENLKTGTDIEKKILAERVEAITSLDEGIDEMKNADVAVLWDDKPMEVKVAGCEVVKVQTCFYYSNVVFVTQKGLPYNGIISYRCLTIVLIHKKVIHIKEVEQQVLTSA